MKDLFGQEIDEPMYTDKKPVGSSYMKFKADNNYRKSDSDYKQCGSCKFCFKNWGRYFKCQWIGDSASEATDIRKGHVCDKWEPE